MAEDSIVDVALDAQAELGEGPVWDEQSGRLVWVDILRRRINWFDPESGKNDAIQIDQTVGAVGLREEGGFILALEDGVYLMDTADSAPRLFAAIEADKPENRLNDGKCDRFGRFWAGSICTLEDHLRHERSAFYRIDPDGTVNKVVEGVTISNGMDWSPDNQVMYYIDSPTHTIAAFDFDVDSGDITNRRVFADISDGSPDGMTVDADGYVWVALWGGWQVQRYSPDGELDRVLRIPTKGVTSVGFGGTDLSDLFITTERFFQTEQELREQHLAGAIFHYSPGVSGLPVGRFGA